MIDPLRARGISFEPHRFRLRKYRAAQARAKGIESRPTGEEVADLQACQEQVGQQTSILLAHRNARGSSFHDERKRAGTLAVCTPGPGSTGSGPGLPRPPSGLTAGLTSAPTLGRRQVTRLSGQRYAHHGPVMNCLAFEPAGRYAGPPIPADSRASRARRPQPEQRQTSAARAPGKRHRPLGAMRTYQ